MTLRASRPRIPAFNLSELKQRGWTPRLVQQHLGAPDRLVRNPAYASAAPMKLWMEGRVLAAEKTPGFARSLMRRRARGEAAKRGVETKRKLTLRVASTTPIRLPTLSLEELAERAMRHYVNRSRDDETWAERAAFNPWPQADAFRDRLCVNYLRHEASPYDDVLGSVQGRVGRADARERIFQRIADAIRQHYPALASEAERQYAERFGHPKVTA